MFHQMYFRTAKGLSPETVTFDGHGEMKVSDEARFYLLGLETVESFFILHQLTGDHVCIQGVELGNICGHQTALPDWRWIRLVPRCGRELTNSHRYYRVRVLLQNLEHKINQGNDSDRCLQQLFEVWTLTKYRAYQGTAPL